MGARENNTGFLVGGGESVKLVIFPLAAEAEEVLTYMSGKSLIVWHSSVGGVWEGDVHPPTLRLIQKVHS